MKKWMLMLTLALGLGNAQMDHSKPHNAPHQHMGSMMELGGLHKLQGKAFDRAFLSMMVPHHQEAVEMAQAVLPVSKDPQVKKWATQIIKDQQQEIDTMQTWLKNLGGMDSKMQKAMQKSMSGMSDDVKKASHPDRAFVQGMVPHHASAIHMASMALEVSENPQVLKLARDIVIAQAGEMHAFKQWLSR